MYKIFSIFLCFFYLSNARSYTITNEAGNYSAPILAGQTILAGNVIISNTNTELIIKATSNNLLGWYIQKVHIYASVNSPVLGNPAPGQFPYQSIFYSPPINNYELHIPLAELNANCSSKIYMALHFEMVRVQNGSIVQTETGWSYGPDVFNSARWGWQFSYDSKCQQNPSVYGCTYTQGYWKNHSKYSKPKTEPWPKQSNSLTSSEDIIMCGLSWYKIITTNPKLGNAWFILAHQYITASLNTYKGASSPLQVDLNTVSNLLINNCSMIKSSSVLGQEFIILGGILASYNEGLLELNHCPP